MSSVISATYNNAITARNMLSACDITVIDTQSVSLGQGFMVLAAAEAAQQGAPPAECIARALETRSRTHLYAALSTVKYLAMSGRVGSIAASVARLLSIEPILTLQEGKLDLLERVRTQKKAWERIIEMATQSAGSAALERVGLVHVAAPQAAREFEQLLRARLACPSEIMLADLTPGLSVHTGSGLVGVALVVKP